MLTVPKNISAADFRKLPLRSNRSIHDYTFLLQAFSYKNTNLVEFFVPENEVIVLPKNSGLSLAMEAVKYDFRLDGSVGRYEGNVGINSDSTGNFYTFNSLDNDLNAGYNFVLNSNPNTVEIGIDAANLPNVPNQKYLRFQTRGVAPVDIQWVMRLRILGTQTFN